MRYALLVAMVCILIIAPSASAAPKHASNPGGDTPGRPEILEDGRYCFEAVEGRDDATCVVLYAHIFDLLNRVPINVQHPHECAVDLARGFTAFPTIEPTYDFNQLTFYSSPGFVEYEEGSCTDPELHKEQGLTEDVQITDLDVPLRGYVYLSADTDEYSMLGVEEDPDTGVMPCVTVRMILQTGVKIGEGDLLAQGSTVRTLLSSNLEPLQGTELPDPCPESEGYMHVEEATEFTIDLSDPTGALPRSKGFIVHIEWWQHDRDGEKIAQREWNVHTGDEYKTRLVLPLKNPVSIDRLDVRPFGGRVYIDTAVNSPWGSYDVDPDSFRLTIRGPDGTLIEPKALAPPILRYSVDHGGHFDPVRATYPWDLAAENLPPGDYTVRLEVDNWQHTGVAVREATFTVEEEGTIRPPDGPDPNPPRGTPAPALPAVLLGLALVALWARKRR